MARAPVTQNIEAVPEADRLDGFPHPRLTTSVAGHDDAEQLLAQSVLSGRMHHGWLITGAEGIGKATLGYALARFLLASETERGSAPQRLIVPATSVAFRQVAALSHPDLLVLRRPWDQKAKRHSTQITIDEVRRLRFFLSHKAEATQWRAVLVDTADDLNSAAANAILKSLEEPPPRTVFILVSSEPGRLLPTIRSRCRQLALSPLSPEALRTAVEQAILASEDGKPQAPSDWPRLIELANGSVRRALGTSSSGGLKLYERVLAVVSSLPRIDWAQAHTLSDELSGAAAEQKFEQFFEFLLDVLARLIRTSATGVGSEADAVLARRLIPPARLAKFAAAWSDITAAKAEAMTLNLDRKALTMETLTRLAAAATDE
jgi:DNA polymerase III subunit delta'